MRILSLAPSNTEILYALGVGADIVGVTAYCDEPIEVRGVPKVGGWTNVYDNLLDRFAPDLIVTSMYLPPQVRELFEERSELFCHVEPKTLAGVYESIEVIGERVEREAEAADLVQEMRDGFAQTAAEHGKRPQVRMYIEEWADPPMVSGNWVPEVAAFAGIEQVLARTGESSGTFALRDLVHADPACIVLSICGQRDRVPVQLVLNRPEWGMLTAVQRDRIFVLDDSLLNRPGPRLVAGARALATLAASVLQPA